MCDGHLPLGAGLEKIQNGLCVKQMQLSSLILPTTGMKYFGLNLIDIF